MKHKMDNKVALLLIILSTVVTVKGNGWIFRDNRYYMQNDYTNRYGPYVPIYTLNGAIIQQVPVAEFLRNAQNYELQCVNVPIGSPSCSHNYVRKAGAPLVQAFVPYVNQATVVANAAEEENIKSSTDCNLVTWIKEKDQECKGHRDYKVNSTDVMESCLLDRLLIAPNTLNTIRTEYQNSNCNGVSQQQNNGGNNGGNNRGNNGRNNRRNNRRNQRQKRAIANFLQFADLKWENGRIPYCFDGTHNEDQKGTVREAMSMWQSKTCITFEEIACNNPQPRLEIKNSGTECLSFVGKAEKQPQVLYLPAPKCFSQGYGLPAQELAHAIGLWHEHQRPDRANFIEIINENIQPKEQPNLISLPELVAELFDLDEFESYDYTSITHGDARAYSKNNLVTIKTLEDEYQRSIGQRSEISYFDYYKVNQAYCSDICIGSNVICSRGYRNPKDCNSCLCPDGFSGPTCADVAPPKNTGGCGSQILTASRSPASIQSPGYPIAYENNIECAWKISANPGALIVLEFENDFGVFCNEKEACFHWVEVKYKTNKTNPGSRFCCNDLPERPLTSEDNEVYVIFRSNYEPTPAEAADSSQFKGFSLKYRSNELANPCDQRPCMNGGTCNPNASPLCICPPPYSGSNCQNSPCTNNPCFNLGTCMVDVGRPNGFRCQCIDGFTGQTCNERDDCDTDEACGGRASSCRTNPNLPNSYYCDCYTGFTGNSCQFDTCNNNECLNGGTCRTVVLVLEGASGGQTCDCPPGFSGNRCETSICGPDACSGGGNCIPDNSRQKGYYCDCFSQFIANQAQDDCARDPCGSPSPCQNGGDCIRLTITMDPNSPEPAYSCNCRPGYSGYNCDGDPCSTNPCQNEGVCNIFTNRQGVATFQCQCRNGYTGTTCDQPLCPIGACSDQGRCVPNSQLPAGYYCDCFSQYRITDNARSDCTPVACKAYPCENGGSCLPTVQIRVGPARIQERRCSCPSGFTGASCQEVEVPDPCLSQPCRNGGRCERNGLSSTYRCNCQNGFTGSNCQTAPNPCASRPCQNGGSCTVQQNMALCSCQQGYSGQYCGEQTVPEDQDDKPKCAENTCGGGNLKPGEISTNVCLSGQMITKILNDTQCHRNRYGRKMCSIISKSVQVEMHYCCNGAINVTAKRYNKQDDVPICIKTGWTEMSDCPRNPRCGGCSYRMRHEYGIKWIHDCKVFQKIRTQKESCSSQMCSRCSWWQHYCGLCAYPGQCCPGSLPGDAHTCVSHAPDMDENPLDEPLFTVEAIPVPVPTQPGVVDNNPPFDYDSLPQIDGNQPNGDGVSNYDSDSDSSDSHEYNQDSWWDRMWSWFGM